MRVKRYVVDELSEAVPLIRNELGKDAVILESKEVKVGGFLGMFRKRKLEVLAAIEPNATSNKPKKEKKLTEDQVDLVIEQILKASQRPKVQESPAASEATAAQSVSNQEKSANVSSTEKSANPNFAARVYSSANAGPNIGQNGAAKAANTQPNPNALEQEQALHYKKAPSDQAVKMTAIEQFIVDEIQSLKQEMLKMSKKGLSSIQLSDSLQALKNRLIEQEVDNQWIDTIIEEFLEKEQNGSNPLSAEELWQLAKARFYEWLAPYQHGNLLSTTRFVQFVGPTGVGKTTTIAKLAANYSIKEQKKLGLITADTYRIAAVEQLRTYANILNIPLEVVFSPLELERAITSLDNAELILMDTAGRNYKSDLFVSEVNSLLPNDEHSESVLVISLTSRTADMKIVAEKFSKYGVRKVVFTKLDETSSYGIIFNLIMLYGLTPLFVTSGQNVPDDIEAFNLEKYIDLMLGEPQHV